MRERIFNTEKIRGNTHGGTQRIAAQCGKKRNFNAEKIQEEIHTEKRRGLLRNERRKEILTQRKYKRNTRRGTQRIATQ